MSGLALLERGAVPGGPTASRGRAAFNQENKLLITVRNLRGESPTILRMTMRPSD
jgi:hypothetical protein